MNSLDAFVRQVRAHPERIALISHGQEFSFRRVWRAVGVMAWHLQQQGVRVGDSVCISRVAQQTHLLAVMALARMGAVSSSVPPTMPAEAKRQVAQRHGVKFWLHGESETWGEAEGIRMIAERDVREPSTVKAPPLVRGLGDNVWRISLSSGTTGTSKSIPWTHSQRERLQRNSMDVFPCGPAERLMVFADIAIGLGMGHAMNHMASGGTVVLPDSPVAAQAFALIESAQPTRITTTTAHAFALVEHLKTLPDWKGPVPGLLSVTVSGAPVPPALMQSLEALFCPSIVVTYGATEVGGVARSDMALRLAQPDSAGRIVPWIDAQAVDGNDQPLAAGGMGLLRFRTRDDAMATHYLGDAEATAKAFRNGWFYPGDRGAIDSDGNLLLAGRSDDVVNLGGIKVDVSRVERLLNGYPGVLESAAVVVDLDGGKKALVAAIVSDGDLLDLAALRKRVRDEGGPLSILAKVDQLPKNPAGKLDRERLKQSLAKTVGPQLAARKAAG